MSIQRQFPHQLRDVLAEFDVDAAVAEAELLEAVGRAEVGVVPGAEPRGGARLEAPEGVLVVERDGGGGDGVAEEARGQVRADLEGSGGVVGGGDGGRTGAGAQGQRRRRHPPPHGSALLLGVLAFSASFLPPQDVWSDGSRSWVAYRPNSCVRAIRRFMAVLRKTRKGRPKAL